MTTSRPRTLIDWQRQRLDARARTPAAHPNARFTAPGRAMPVRSRRSGRTPTGVPIAAILFGGRRASAVPLVARRSTGSTASSRRDHGARRPPRRPATVGGCASTRSRCCRSAATTWATTSATGSSSGAARRATLPRIYYVNWFRKDERRQVPVARLRREQRVLEWILGRSTGSGRGHRDPDRQLPAPGGPGDHGSYDRDDLVMLLTVDEDLLRDAVRRDADLGQRRPPAAEGRCGSTPTPVGLATSGRLRRRRAGGGRSRPRPPADGAGPARGGKPASTSARSPRRRQWKSSMSRSAAPQMGDRLAAAPAKPDPGAVGAVPRSPSGEAGMESDVEFDQHQRQRRASLRRGSTSSSEPHGGAPGRLVAGEVGRRRS